MGNSSLVPIAAEKSQPDGWAWIEGLPAGRELSVVAQSSEGDRSVAELFRVVPRGKATVDPLAILRPATLVVEPKLGPEFRQRYPKGRIESIVIDPEGKSSPSEQRCELELHAGQSKEAGHPALLELDQKVDVARRAEAVGDRGSEDRQAPDPVAFAEGCQVRRVELDGKARRHGWIVPRGRDANPVPRPSYRRPGQQ